MLKVGSSISMRGKAMGFSGSAIVSPMSTDPKPTMATMSPTSAVLGLGAAELVKDHHAVDRSGDEAYCQT